MDEERSDPGDLRYAAGEPADLKGKAQEILRILLHRRRVMFVCAGLFVATVMVLTVLTTPQYEATATVQIELLGPEVVTFRDVVSADNTSAASWKFYQTQYKLLKSRAVLLLAVEKLDLTRRPELMGRKLSPIRRLAHWSKTKVSAAGPVQDPVGGAVRFIESRLTIRPVRDSQLVEVAFMDSDPALARDVANAVTEAFLEFNFRSRFETTKIAREFLTKEVAQVQDELTQLEKELQDYGESKDILAKNDGTADIAEQALANLNRDYVDARSRMAVAEARYLSQRNAAPDSIPEVLHSPLIAKLKEQYAEIERRLSQMAERFKDDWPPLMQVRTELDQARTRLETEAERIAQQVRSVQKAEYDRARAEANELGAQLTQQKGQVQRVQRDGIEYASLRSEIETKRGILAGLVTRQSQMSTSARLKETRSSNIRIVDPAELPKSPVRPNKRVNLLLALVVGSLLAVATALALEHLDNTIKTEQDVTRLTGLAVLGHVPLVQPLVAATDLTDGAVESRRKVDLATHLDSRSGFAEALRSIRTSLLLATPDHPPRHLMITSCQPRDGKSTITANLSIVLSQLGKRVLLVDADLRVPRLSRAFGLSTEVGLSSYLSGNSSLEDIVLDTEIPLLKAIPSGPIPPNPSELLGSPRLLTLLERLGEQAFDFLVFDSSPLLSVSDPLILASRLDATIVVVRAGETARESLLHATARLRQSRARVIGAVLNGVTEKRGDYYYGRYRDKYTGPPADADSAASPPVVRSHRAKRWARQA